MRLLPTSTVLRRGFLLTLAALLMPFSGLSMADQAAPAASSNATCGLAIDVQTRLDQVLAAADTAAYTGTLLIEYNNDREFIGVNSADDSGRGSFLRLSREANGNPETVSPMTPIARSACALAPFYGFNIERGQVVAGREAYRLTVRPKDTLRLGYVMDIDSEYHLPLRVVTATPDGQVLERFEFADIQFQNATQAPTSSVEPEPIHYTFAALPPGFTVIGEGEITRAAAPVEFLVVSDGLASVSVFVEPRPRSLANGEGVVLRGATIAYSRGTSDDHLITVLGEVPVTTARLLADAVRRQPAD